MKYFLYSFIFYLSITTSYPQVQTTVVSHYLLPEFSEGIVQMKSGIKNEFLLNYNSLTEEMIFKNKDKTLAIGYTEMLLIDTIFIKDRKFFNLNGRFVEIIYHSKCDLYAEHKCSVIYPNKPAAYDGTSQTSASSSYGSYKSGSVVYNLKLPDDYKIKSYNYYWLKRNGELNKFVNMKQLLKLYSDKNDLFKAYVKKYNVKYDVQDSIVRLIKYLDAH